MSWLLTTLKESLFGKHSIDGGKQKLFIHSINTNDIDTIRKLIIDPQVDLSTNDNEVIKAASQNGCLEIVRLLCYSNF